MYIPLIKYLEEKKSASNNCFTNLRKTIVHADSFTQPRIYRLSNHNSLKLFISQQLFGNVSTILYWM